MVTLSKKFTLGAVTTYHVVNLTSINQQSIFTSWMNIKENSFMHVSNFSNFAIFTYFYVSMMFSQTFWIKPLSISDRGSTIRSKKPLLDVAVGKRAMQLVSARWCVVGFNQGSPRFFDNFRFKFSQNFLYLCKYWSYTLE